MLLCGDADNKTATVGDLRRMLQEQSEQQKAEIAAMKGVLEQLIVELKCGSSTKGTAPAPSGGGAEMVPFAEPVSRSAPPEPTAEFDGPLALHVTPSEKTKPSTGDGSQGLDGARDTKSKGAVPQSPAHGSSPFSGLKGTMAKAFGFDFVAESMQGQGKPEQVVVVADDAPLSKSGTGGVDKPQSYISRHAKKNAREHLSLLQRFVRSAAFENLTGTIVCANAIFIGVHANLRAMHPTRCMQDWDTVFWVFHGIFSLELITRIAIYRRDFLFGEAYRWNMFDSIIVLAGLLEEVIKAALGQSGCGTKDLDSSANVMSGITVLRILRVLRVVRIVKAFRTMTIFRDLRIMVASTLGCLVPLAWACVLLFFIQWVFSVYFLYLSTDYVEQAVHKFGIDVLDDDTKPYKELRTFFGSLWLSIYTLYRTITGGGDWGPPADVLHRATGEIHPMLVYMFFIALTVFAVLNVITGVFVEQATKNAMADRELIIQDSLSNRNHYKDDVLAVFREADTDDSGQLTVEEFEVHLRDPRVQAFLESLELDGMGAKKMFHLLDLDGNGWVSATEFVTGCMCLKGDAKTMDVAALLLEVNKMSSSLSKSIARLEGRLNAESAAKLLVGGQPERAGPV